MKKSIKVPVMNADGSVTMKARVFNTETSTKVGTRNVSAFGDPFGYQEILYRTKNGVFFLHAIGGESSVVAQDKSAELGENGYELLCYLSLEETEAWLANNQIVEETV